MVYTIPPPIKKVYLQSVIPKSLSSKISPEIISFFEAHHDSNLSIKPFQASSIPNNILTVSGGASNVVTTYNKIFSYLGGLHLDYRSTAVRRLEIGKPDRLHRPTFIIPQAFKYDFVRIGLGKQNFKKYHQDVRMTFFPYMANELWSVRREGLAPFLNYILLSTIESRQYFAEPIPDETLFPWNDEDLTVIKFPVSKNDLSKMLAEPQRIENLKSQYLFNFKINEELLKDKSKSPDEVLDLVEVVGPGALVQLVTDILGKVRDRNEPAITTSSKATEPVDPIT